VLGSRVAASYPARDGKFMMNTGGSAGRHLLLKSGAEEWRYARNSNVFVFTYLLASLNGRIDFPVSYTETTVADIRLQTVNFVQRKRRISSALEKVTGPSSRPAGQILDCQDQLTVEVLCPATDQRNIVRQTRKHDRRGANAQCKRADGTKERPLFLASERRAKRKSFSQALHADGLEVSMASLLFVRAHRVGCVATRRSSSGAKPAARDCASMCISGGAASLRVECSRSSRFWRTIFAESD